MITPEQRAKLVEYKKANNIGTQSGSAIDRILQNASKVSTTTPIVTEPQPEPGLIDKAVEINRGLATGFAKEGTKRVLDIGGTIQKGTSKALNALIPGTENDIFVEGQGVFNPESEKGGEARQFLEPTSTSEKVGGMIERGVEMVGAGALASKAEAGVNVLSGMIKSPFLEATLKSGARILGKAGVQGLTTAGLTYAQTGDAEKAKEAGTIAGVFRGALATIGEGAKAMHLPERLYSTIFKNSKNDMLSELKANGVANLQKTDPELYKNLVANGIVKADATGKPILNQTLAEEALERGLKGSVDGMANEVVQGQLKSELTARTIAKNYKGTVDVTEAQYKNVLSELANEYDDVGFGEISKQARDLVSKIDNTGGQVTAEDALNIRRFLDRVRVARSFDAPATKLSLAQANLKTLADTLRTRVNKIPGMDKVMKDYSFYIDSLEALAKEAARTGNNQVISMIDSLFLAGTAASGSPIPVGVGLLRKMLLTSPSGVTGMAQGIKEGVTSPIGGALITGGSQTASDLQ
jgi:hypothetical protein